MILNLRSSPADVRLQIFTETEAGLRAQFLELRELRERLREAELSAGLKDATRARSPRLLNENARFGGPLNRRDL
jgi:hypothetical protein